jgi:hypothetical protein
MTRIAIWCFACVIYLVFAGSLGTHELVVAAVLATLSTLWARAIRENSRRQFSAAREQVAPLLRAIGDLFPATLRSGAALLKAAARSGSPGRALSCRFHFGLDDEPRQRSRRAFSVLCASLAPNRFVINIERGRAEAIIARQDCGADFQSQHAGDGTGVLAVDLVGGGDGAARRSHGLGAAASKTAARVLQRSRTSASC